MTEYEAHQEHIRYTHDTYCRIVIRHASFDAARMLAARWKREISLEYLTEEKFVPLSTPAGITHYTLLRKVVCQMGALPPLETPTRKGGTLPLHGAHTAFSCYPALRLYRLSKSQHGIGVVSLIM